VDDILAKKAFTQESRLLISKQAPVCWCCSRTGRRQVELSVRVGKILAVHVGLAT
jgi:hypothetical protein